MTLILAGTFCGRGQIVLDPCRHIEVTLECRTSVILKSSMQDDWIPLVLVDEGTEGLIYLYRQGRTMTLAFIAQIDL